MRAVVQRVRQARVKVDERTVGEIAAGLVVLLGVTGDDSPDDAAYLARKVGGLRVFTDAAGKFNLAPGEVGAEFLVVSQFTLYGDCRKGNRPSFSEAARPEAAVPLYEAFVAELRAQGYRVETGEFQAHMLVEIHNDGPVTLILDSPGKGGTR